MSSLSIHLELLDHRVAEWAFRQHAFDRFLKCAPRKTLLHFLEICFVDTTWVTGMTVVSLVQRLGTCHAQFACVDDDNKVACIDVWCKFWLVFAAQSECHFAGNTSEDFVRRVNHK